MHQKPHPFLPSSLSKVYGVIRGPEPLRLPEDHPCHGCVHCNTEGTVPICFFFTCKRHEYEAFWNKRREEIHD